MKYIMVCTPLRMYEYVHVHMEQGKYARVCTSMRWTQFSRAIRTTTLSAPRISAYFVQMVRYIGVFLSTYSYVLVRTGIYYDTSMYQDLPVSTCMYLFVFTYTCKLSRKWRNVLPTSYFRATLGV